MTRREKEKIVKTGGCCGYDYIRLFFTQKSYYLFTLHLLHKFTERLYRKRTDSLLKGFTL